MKKLTSLVGILTSGVLLAQSVPAFAQNVQVNGSGSQEQPAATPQPAAQVQVNTPAPAPQAPIVINNSGNSDTGAYRSRVPGRLMVSGATLFGVTYISTVLGAAIASDICNAESRLGCREASWPIYIPVIGPFIQMGYLSGNGANTGRAVLAIDGALQAGGVAMFVAGAVLWGVNSSRPQHAKVQMVPYGSSTGTGLMALGRF